MSSADDARAVELKRLKLALTTFALQLDAFEMQAEQALQAVSRTSDVSRQFPPEETESDSK